MAKAKYQLALEDLSDIVLSREDLERKFKHSLPRGTQIFASDPIAMGDKELPRTIEVVTPRPYEFPKTKINGLYALAERN